MKGEITVQMRGGGMLAVLHLLRTKQLVFEVVATRHHGQNLRQTALRKLAIYPVLRNALVYATAQGCLVRFRHGRGIEVDIETDTILVGIDADPNEVAAVIAGPEFQVHLETTDESH